MKTSKFESLLSTLFKSHPWHGVAPLCDTKGAVSCFTDAEDEGLLVKAFIEMVPGETVKFELDKGTGHLHVDRPQFFSSSCPTLYGFVPQTYCGDRVGKRCMESTGRKRVKGDGDPLDICVITEKDFSHGDLFLRVRPIGGLRMIDKGQADDKIIAVLDQDIAYGGVRDISELQAGVLTRLKHYFLSYKHSFADGESKRPVVKIAEVYGRTEAMEVIRLSMDDYVEKFGTQADRLAELKGLLAQG